MTILNELQKLGSDVINQVSSCYGTLFPIEVRYNLADFLESRLVNIDIPNENCQQFDQSAIKFIADFIVELETKARAITQDNMMPTKWRLLEASNNLKFHNPAQVFSHLIRCLAYEQELLHQAEYPMENESVYVNNRIDSLINHIRETEHTKKDWLRKYESYRIDLYELSASNDVDMSGTLSTDYRETNIIFSELRQSALEMQLQQLNDDLNYLIDRFRLSIEQAQGLTTSIIDKHLIHWKLNQKIFASSFAIISLDTIQVWCGRLAEGLWNIRKYIRTMQSYYQEFAINHPNSQIFLTDLPNMVSNVLQHLINGSFIIDRQPPQVLRTNNRFTASVRLLVGHVLSIKITNPDVKVSILSGAQVQRIAQTTNFREVTVGEILNGNSAMDYSDAQRQLGATFLNMQLKAFKRPGRRTSDNVTDEKFALLFKSTVIVGDMTFFIQEISLPVVVIVHGQQEPQACATILWDNSFASVDRSPFTVPDQVTWRQFSEALNQKFYSVCNRGLTPQNLHFLAEKFFNTTFAGPVSDDTLITWVSFCKKNLPSRQFTFWDWFYATLRLTKDFLREPSSDGFIDGYISKQKVEEQLRNCSHGTFILRFSDSELGGISIAWYKSNGTPGVLHIQPFNSKDFSTRSLSDRLSDLEELTTLYPNIDKKEAFDKYKVYEGNLYSPNNGLRRQEYVKAFMRLVVQPTEEVYVSNSVLSPIS